MTDITMVLSLCTAIIATAIGLLIELCTLDSKRMTLRALRYRVIGKRYYATSQEVREDVTDTWAKIEKILKLLGVEVASLVIMIAATGF